MVHRVAALDRHAWRLDDQHDSIQQLQGDSVEAEAAVSGDRFAHPGAVGHLEVFRTRPDRLGLFVCCHRRRASYRARTAPSLGFPDRVIHAIS